MLALAAAPLIVWVGVFVYLWRIDSKVGKLKQ
ncbi:MAG: CcmD family protein [Armatimonadetes bacterium]|nr:CcmD family protein [Armatimonadota bacterium]